MRKPFSLAWEELLKDLPEVVRLFGGWGVVGERVASLLQLVIAHLRTFGWYKGSWLFGYKASQKPFILLLLYLWPWGGTSELKWPPIVNGAGDKEEQSQNLQLNLIYSGERAAHVPATPHAPAGRCTTTSSVKSNHRWRPLCASTGSHLGASWDLRRSPSEGTSPLRSAQAEPRSEVKNVYLKAHVAGNGFTFGTLMASGRDR